MSYCPKCGNKVDPATAFCSNCGASLKPGTWQGTTTNTPPTDYRHRRQEKSEKNEKQEKHEKPGGNYRGYIIGGLVVLLIGIIAFVNTTTNFLNGPIVSALVLVIIGVVIVVLGILFSSQARKRNPVPI
jgi:hypothetical protein